MDLKIKINGKYVDPETWQPPSASSQVQQTQPQVNAEPLLGDLDALFSNAAVSQ